MKTQSKQKRKGFAGYAIMAAIALTATSVVVLPNIEHKRDKFLAEELQTKEKILYDIYKTYFNGLSIDNCADLVGQAQGNGILPAGFNCNNGYQDNAGNDLLIEFTVVIDNTTVTLTIDPSLDDNERAKRFYAGYKAKNENLTPASRVDLAFDEDGLVENIYEFDVRKKETEQREDSINTKRAEELRKAKMDADNSIIDEGYEKNEDGSYKLDASGEKIAKNTDKQWYDYDKSTDMYAVKEYNSESEKWEVITDEDGHPVYKSAGGQGVDGKYYVESKVDKTASSAGEGSRLVELNNGGETTEYVAGRVRKVDNNGNPQDTGDDEEDYEKNADGTYKLDWIQVKTESEGNANVEVPNSVEFLNDMINRDSTNNYFQANQGAYTELKNIWGVDISIARYEKYWRSIGKIEVPSYTDTSITQKVSRYVYLAKDLESLPRTENEEGDVAFLMMNNEIGENGNLKGRGYKANQDETLYPEAIYYNNEWVMYAPTISDMMEFGLNNFTYVASEELYFFNTGNYSENSFQWRYGTHKSFDTKFLVTNGQREDFPLESDEDKLKYKDTTHFLSVKMNPDSNTRTSSDGVKYSDGKLYEWQYTETIDTKVINSLTDELNEDGTLPN